MFQAVRTIGLLALLAVAGAIPAAAQFRLVEASLPEGTASMPMVDSIHFHFNRKLPFNSLFSSKFRWEPRRLAFRRYIFLDADRQNPRFTIEHQADTDYAVYVYGVRSESGAPMERPFTLNYTTRESAGSGSVRGSVVAGTRMLFGGDAALLALKAAGRTVGRAMSPIDGDPEGRKVQASSRVLRSDVPDKSPTALRARLTASAQGDLDVQRTVVFLLDRFELDPIYWPVRAAAAIEADDSYRFDHVRPGSYYPVAINFADNDGVQIGAYGFYDADGDLSPDAVTVGSEPVDSVRLTLFPYETTTAMTGRVLAENRAKSIVPDAVLTGIRGGGVATDGTAPEWIYVFHSPTESSALVITVDPVTVDARIDTSADTGASDIPITTDVLDSDTALAIAWERGGSSFSASYDPSDVTISLEGGNVRHIFPLESDDLIWAVNFRAEGGTDSLLVVLDMKNGEEVDITAISSELHPGKEETTIVGVFPNPFGQVASVDFAVSRPGRVVLEVLDMLGRQRAVVVDDHFETGRHGIVWQPRDLESGVFVLRLRSGEATSTAKVIRIR